MRVCTAYKFKGVEKCHSFFNVLLTFREQILGGKTSTAVCVE